MLYCDYKTLIQQLVVNYILLQIIKQEFAYVRSTGGKSVLFAPKFETEKWLKKRTAVKISVSQILVLYEQGKFLLT